VRQVKAYQLQRYINKREEAHGPREKACNWYWNLYKEIKTYIQTPLLNLLMTLAFLTYSFLYWFL